MFVKIIFFKIKYSVVKQLEKEIVDKNFLEKRSRKIFNALKS